MSCFPLPGPRALLHSELRPGLQWPRVGNLRLRAGSWCGVHLQTDHQQGRHGARVHHADCKCPHSKGRWPSEGSQTDNDFSFLSSSFLSRAWCFEFESTTYRFGIFRFVTLHYISSLAGRRSCTLTFILLVASLRERVELGRSDESHCETPVTVLSRFLQFVTQSLWRSSSCETCCSCGCVCFGSAGRLRIGLIIVYWRCGEDAPAPD